MRWGGEFGLILEAFQARITKWQLEDCCAEQYVQGRRRWGYVWKLNGYTKVRLHS